MGLMVQIPSELEKRIEAEAAERGVSVDEYVQGLLERMLVGPGELPSWMNATKEEWLKAFNAWMDSHDSALPPLSDEAVSREGFYGERG
jgi:hypothetical protein